MALRGSVGFYQGLRYRGGSPMVTWMLHRITGFAILVFVGTHVFASFFMQQIGADWATAINTVYESWIFQLFIVFFVLFHALNGLRIALLDVWPQFLQYEREALWLQLCIFFPVYALTAFMIIRNGLSG